MKLRRTQTSDLAFIHAAEHDVANSLFITPWDKERHEKLLVDKNTFHAIILDDDGRSVGFVFVNGLQRIDHVLELKRVVVTDKGRGFGRATIRAVRDLAFGEWGGQRLWLDVRDFNEGARRLYESEGFRLEGKGEANLLIYSLVTPRPE